LSSILYNIVTKGIGKININKKNNVAPISIQNILEELGGNIIAAPRHNGHSTNETNIVMKEGSASVSVSLNHRSVLYIFCFINIPF
jgi:hypothetical protein